MARSSTTFKPGQVTNPKGRPKKGQTITEEVMKLLEVADVEFKRGGRKVKLTRREAIAEVLVRRTLNGDLQAMRLLMGYTDGLPKQRIEMTGAEGGPVEVVFPAAFQGV